MPPSPQWRRSIDEQQAERHWPQHQALCFLEAEPPPADVCFLTVADYRFYRGLEALLLGLVAVYPGLNSPIVVVHDGSLTPYLQNRLLAITPLLQFVVPRPPWAPLLPHNSANRKRIGILGYLNVHALALRGYRRVIVLDSDVLIEGPLHPLWAEGEAFRLVPDCGARPWTPISPLTQRPVLNSGVISIPGSVLTPAAENRIAGLIAKAGEPCCPLLDRFADQKIWNQFLIEQPVELLPINFNCNSKYLFRYLGGVAQGLSLIHFAGPKPWLTWPWLQPSPEYQEADASFQPACWLWNDRYCRLLATWRATHYRDAQRLDPGLGSQASAVVSAELGALLEHAERGCSLHLVSADADLLGGFATAAPHWPEPWIAALARVEQLHLWMPFELEPLLRDLPIPPGLRLHWLLIESPFSAALEREQGAWDPGPVAVCFEPWSPNPIEALGQSVRRRLEQVGITVELLVY